MGRLFPMGILVPSSILCEANYTPTLGFHEILLYPSKKLPSSTCVQGQGQRPRVPDCDGAGTAKWSYPASEVRGGGWEELPHTPTPEAGGDGWEEQPHVQGTVAAPVQEALEELSHAEGQEGWQ